MEEQEAEGGDPNKKSWSLALFPYLTLFSDQELIDYRGSQIPKRKDSATQWGKNSSPSPSTKGLLTTDLIK